MMRRYVPVFFALLSACGTTPSGGNDAATDTRASHDGGPSPDASTADASTADASTTDVTTTDAPASDAPLPACRLAAHDLPGIQRSTSGHFTTLYDFPATMLHNTRTVTVYVPDGPGPFPVLYAHDGQNLFDASRAGFGVEWQLDEAADALATEGIKFIIVAIDNNADRIPEYTPVSDPQYGGGNGEAYLDFIIHDLKPFIDYNFATRCEAADTGMMGSSLGGLISFYAGHTHSDVFGRIAALSPSLWWNNRSEVAAYNAQTAASPITLWIDGGSDEADPGADGLSYVVQDVREVRDHALAIGHRFNDTLGYYEAERQVHNELAWQRRLPSVLRFMFGPRMPAAANGYVWSFRNPTPVGQETSAVLQMAFADGRRMTVPTSLAPITATDAALTVTGDRVSSNTANAYALSAAYGGVTGHGTQYVWSDPSSAVEVIFEVSAPASTPGGDSVYVTGDSTALGMWDPGAVTLQRLSNTAFRGAFLLPTNQPTLFKYTRGSWATVQVNPDGSDVGNLSDDAADAHARYDVVDRWHDQ